MQILFYILSLYHLLALEGYFYERVVHHETAEIKY